MSDRFDINVTKRELYPGDVLKISKVVAIHNDRMLVEVELVPNSLHRISYTPPDLGVSVGENVGTQERLG